MRTRRILFVGLLLAAPLAGLRTSCRIRASSATSRAGRFRLTTPVPGTRSPETGVPGLRPRRQPGPARHAGCAQHLGRTVCRGDRGTDLCLRRACLRPGWRRLGRGDLCVRGCPVLRRLLLRGQRSGTAHRWRQPCSARHLDRGTDDRDRSCGVGLGARGDRGAGLRCLRSRDLDRGFRRRRVRATGSRLRRKRETDLCLNGGRFRVHGSFRVPAQDREGPMHSRRATEDSGLFWFFEPNNLEIFVKVLSACGLPSHNYWVFAARLTNVEVTLIVEDTATGERRQDFQQRRHRVSADPGHERVRNLFLSIDDRWRSSSQERWGGAGWLIRRPLPDRHSMKQRRSHENEFCSRPGSRQPVVCWPRRPLSRRAHPWPMPISSWPTPGSSAEVREAIRTRIDAVHERFRRTHGGSSPLSSSACSAARSRRSRRRCSRRSFRAVIGLSLARMGYLSPVSGSSNLWAGVQLPSGVSIQYLGLYYYDNHAGGDVQALLQAYSGGGPGSGAPGSTTLASAASEGMPGYGYDQVSLNYTVNNLVAYDPAASHLAVHLDIGGIGTNLQFKAVELWWMRQVEPCSGQSELRRCSDGPSSVPVHRGAGGLRHYGRMRRGELLP